MGSIFPPLAQATLRKSNYTKPAPPRLLGDGLGCPKTLANLFDLFFDAAFFAKSACYCTIFTHKGLGTTSPVLGRGPKADATTSARHEHRSDLLGHSSERSPRPCSATDVATRHTTSAGTSRNQPTPVRQPKKLTRKRAIHQKRYDFFSMIGSWAFCRGEVARAEACQMLKVFADGLQ